MAIADSVTGGKGTGPEESGRVLASVLSVLGFRESADAAFRLAESDAEARGLAAEEIGVQLRWVAQKVRDFAETPIAPPRNERARRATPQLRAEGAAAPSLQPEREERARAANRWRVEVQIDRAQPASTIATLDTRAAAESFLRGIWLECARACSDWPWEVGRLADGKFDITRSETGQLQALYRLVEEQLLRWPDGSTRREDHER